ncbi:hypothetical protein ACFQXB_05290 [Plastorhodobacter daqingensis]|uniref:DUF2802 domain-containing protein n=1 Tax=Plastorhodobacter daqingensis TaxID=1387281 RepID=A0ABW2UI06_9RHOB
MTVLSSQILAALVSQAVPLGALALFAIGLWLAARHLASALRLQSDQLARLSGTVDGLRRDSEQQGAEILALRLRIDALQARAASGTAAQEAALHALCREIETIQTHLSGQDDERALGRAIELARSGLDAAAIARETGLMRSEIEIITLGHRPRRIDGGVAQPN